MHRWLVRSVGGTARALVVAAAVSAVAATSGASAGLPIASAATPAFTIHGSVNALYPGATKHLTLTVTNDEPFAIVVTAMSTTVADASPACTHPYLAVAAFSGALRVGALHSASVKVTVVLKHGAPNSCQDARFPLHYVGTARRA